MRKSLFAAVLVLTSSFSFAGSLTDVMNVGIIGNNRAYVESKIGPAKESFGNTRVYDIKGCTVSIDYAKKAVASVELQNVSSKCDFDTGKIGLEGKASQLTMGAFAETGFPIAREGCFSLCGNAMDPEYSLWYEGSHAQGFLNFEVTASYANSEKILDKFVAETLKAMRKSDRSELSGDYVGKLISEEAYTKIFIKHFAKVKVSKVKFGNF